MPSFAGTYEVRLFSGGFNLRHECCDHRVRASTSVQATLTANASSVAPGGSVTVRLANGPGGTDWLALTLVGAADRESAMDLCGRRRHQSRLDGDDAEHGG